MKLTPHQLAVLGLAAVGCLAVPCPAPADGQFGPQVQAIHIPFSAFHARFPSLFDPAVECCGSDGYVWPFTGTPGTAALIAPVDASVLPSGAHITEFRAYVGDGSAVADEDILVALCRTGVIEATGTAPDGDCPLVMTSEGGPGNTVISIPADHTVQYRTGCAICPPSSMVYTLIVEFGTGTKLRQYIGDELRLRQVVIYFERQVKPRSNLLPPTFDDVPEESAQYDFIEALAAAGITAGCDASNYCPDAPVTRGQMAVLLARALGLNWP